MHKARRSAYCFIVDCVGSCSCYYCYCYCCRCHFCCYDCRSFIYWSHKRVKSTTYIMSWPNWSFTFGRSTRVSRDWVTQFHWKMAHHICVRNLSCQPQGRRGNLATSGCTVINFTPAERRDAAISHFASPSRILHFNSCKMHFAFFSCDCSRLDTVHRPVASTCHALLSSCHRVMWN